MGSEPDDSEAETSSGDLPSAASDRVRMNVWVRRDLYDDVVALCRSEDTSLTNVVKTALKDFVKKHQQGA